MNFSQEQGNAMDNYVIVFLVATLGSLILIWMLRFARWMKQKLQRTQVIDEIIYRRLLAQCGRDQVCKSEVLMRIQTMKSTHLDGRLPNEMK